MEDNDVWNPDVTGKIFELDGEMYMMNLIENDSSKDVIGKKVVCWSYGYGNYLHNYLGVIKDVIVCADGQVLWVFTDNTIQSKCRFEKPCIPTRCADLLFEITILRKVHVKQRKITSPSKLRKWVICLTVKYKTKMQTLFKTIFSLFVIAIIIVAASKIRYNGQDRDEFESAWKHEFIKNAKPGEYDWSDVNTYTRDEMKTRGYVWFNGHFHKNGDRIPFSELPRP